VRIRDRALHNTESTNFVPNPAFGQKKRPVSAQNMTRSQFLPTLPEKLKIGTGFQPQKPDNEIRDII